MSPMGFDLHRALAKKGEMESARLDSFAFRLRARKAALMTERLNARTLIAPSLDPADVARRVATSTDAEILSHLRSRLAEAMADDAWIAFALGAEADARAELVALHGDPEPYRLAWLRPLPGGRAARLARLSDEIPPTDAAGRAPPVQPSAIRS